jgi:hypothetical protein
MEHDFEQFCRESGESFETIPDVHRDDFIFKFILGHPNWTDPRTLSGTTSVTGEVLLLSFAKH